MLPNKVPGGITRAIVVLIFFSFLPLAYISVLRVTPSSVPRISIVPDMDSQQTFKTQSENPMFADGRGMRYYPAGTVARGEEDIDTHLYQGIVNGQWATTFPMPVTQELMDRGQHEFNIYCAPCHGYSGYGNGMVAKRADDLALAGTPGMSWVQPKNLTEADTRARPAGHIFNTITNGIRTMPSYKGQIKVEDRWAIVLYVRALQRSQSASLADAPSDQAQTLQAGRADAILAEQKAAAEKAAQAAKEAEQAKKDEEAKKAKAAEDAAAAPGGSTTPPAADAGAAGTASPAEQTPAAPPAADTAGNAAGGQPPADASKGAGK